MSVQSIYPASEAPAAHRLIHALAEGKASKWSDDSLRTIAECAKAERQEFAALQAQKEFGEGWA